MDYSDRLKLLAAYVSAHDDYQKHRASVSEISGETARFLRGLTKLSVRKFAAVLGVTPSYLSKVERGKEPLSPDLARTLLEMHNK